MPPESTNVRRRIPAAAAASRQSHAKFENPAGGRRFGPPQNKSGGRRATKLREQPFEALLVIDVVPGDSTVVGIAFCSA
jgi:hypothetical protein